MRRFGPMVALVSLFAGAAACTMTRSERFDAASERQPPAAELLDPAPAVTATVRSPSIAHPPAA